MARHPSIEAITKYFEFGHLPEHLQPISAACAELKDAILHEISTDSAELTTGFRKLLEAKDCFVRAGLEATTPEEGK